MHLQGHRCGGCVWYEAHSGGRSEAVKIGRVGRFEAVKIGCVLVASGQESDVSIFKKEEKWLVHENRENKNAATDIMLSE